MRSLAACICLFSAALAFACGDDDEGSDATPTPDPVAAEVESTLTQLVEDYNAGDASAFTAAFTDRGLAQFFSDSTLSRAELEELAEGVVGSDEVTIIEIRGIAVEGDAASAELLASVGKTISLESYALVRGENGWLIDSTSLLPPEIPGDVANIEVTATEFAFEYDAEEISDGNVAFTLANEGEQDHELGLARVTEDFDIEAVIAADPASEDLPPGVVDIIGGTFAPPGGTGVLLFTEALAPGDYAILCLLADEASQQSHAALGMHSEFEVP
jgi:hypothetical protein